MSQCKYMEFGCEQLSASAIGSTCSATRFQQQQHYKTRAVSHLQIIRTQPTSTTTSTTATASVDALEEEHSCRVMCGECAAAVEAEKTCEIKDITEFLEEIRRQGSVNVVDLCQKIVKESPLKAVFEKRKTQALATLAKLSQRVAAFATVIKGRELGEGYEKFLNEDIIAQNIQHMEFIQQTILAFERNHYSSREEFMQMLGEASESSSKNKEILAVIESRALQEDEVALREMEIIQLKLSSEVTRVFAFFDNNLQPHFQNLEGSISSNESVEGAQKNAYDTSSVSKLFNSKVKRDDENSQGSVASSHHIHGTSLLTTNCVSSQTSCGSSSSEASAAYVLRMAKSRLMQIQNQHPNVAAAASVSAKTSPVQLPTSSNLQQQQQQTSSSIRMTRSQTAAAASALSSMTSPQQKRQSQQACGGSYFQATPLTETFLLNGQEMMSTNPFSTSSHSRSSSAIKPKALFASAQKQASTNSQQSSLIHSLMHSTNGKTSASSDSHSQQSHSHSHSLSHQQQYQLQLQQQQYQQQQQSQQQQQASAKKISAAIFASIFPSSSSNSASKIMQSPQKQQSQSRLQHSALTTVSKSDSKQQQQQQQQLSYYDSGSTAKQSSHHQDTWCKPDMRGSHSLRGSALRVAQKIAEEQYYNQSADDCLYDDDDGDEDKENQGNSSQFLDASEQQQQMMLSSIRSPSDKRKERRLRKREQKKLKKLKIQEEIQLEQDVKLMKLRQLDAERTRQRQIESHLKHQQQQHMLEVLQQQQLLQQARLMMQADAMENKQMQQQHLISPTKKPISSSGFRYSSIDVAAKNSRIQGGSVIANGSNVAQSLQASASKLHSAAAYENSQREAAAIAAGANTSNFENLLHSFRNQTNQLAMVSSIHQASSQITSQSAQQQKYHPTNQPKHNSMKRSHAQSLTNSAIGQSSATSSTQKGRVPLWNVGCFEGDISPSLSQEPTAAATAAAAAGGSAYKRQKTSANAKNEEESAMESSTVRGNRFTAEGQLQQTQGSIARENTTVRPGWKQTVAAAAVAAATGASGVNAYSNPFLIHQSHAVDGNSERIEVSRNNSHQGNSESIEFANLLKEQLERKIREESMNCDVYSTCSSTKRLQFQLVYDEDADDIRSSSCGALYDQRFSADMSPTLYSPGVQFSPIDSEDIDHKP